MLAHKNADVYWRCLRTQSSDELDEHLGKRLYTLAGIANEKYLYINRSIVFLSIGAVIAGLFVFNSI